MSILTTEELERRIANLEAENRELRHAALEWARGRQEFTVTREMLGVAHDVLLKHGMMLSHTLLTEIYTAMEKVALAKHGETK